MVSTKCPYGAIHDNWIAWLLPLKYGKFYIMDKFSTIMEVEETIYNTLLEKGIKVYEGKLNKIRTHKL